MENKKIKYNGRLDNIKYQKINHRCKYIDVIYNDEQKVGYGIIRTVRYNRFLRDMAFNEFYDIIAVGDIEEGRRWADRRKEELRVDYSFCDMNGVEYKYCVQEYFDENSWSYNKWRKNYFILDPDDQVQHDGWYFQHITSEDSPIDFLEEVNREIWY